MTSPAVLYSALLILCFMTAACALALVKKDNSVADVAWGLGFVLVAVTGLTHLDEPSSTNYLMTGLVAAWGLRLAFHIFRRNHGKPEDQRYVEMRKKWGKHQAFRSLTDVFMLQGILLLIISLPIIWTNSAAANLNWLSYLGLAIWLIGFFFEAIGDYQISRFIKTKKPGQIMMSGLWKYTRHPNYFGEVTLWWGIFIISLSATGIWWLLISPLLISFLILKVSGIPMLEKKYEGNPEFESYKKRTNAFFPWPPKIRKQ